MSRRTEIVSIYRIEGKIFRRKRFNQILVSTKRSSYRRFFSSRHWTSELHFPVFALDKEQRRNVEILRLNIFFIFIDNQQKSFLVQRTNSLRFQRSVNRLDHRIDGKFLFEKQRDFFQRRLDRPSSTKTNVDLSPSRISKPHFHQTEKYETAHRHFCLSQFYRCCADAQRNRKMIDFLQLDSSQILRQRIWPSRKTARRFSLSTRLEQKKKKKKRNFKVQIRDLKQNESRSILLLSLLFTSDRITEKNFSPLKILLWRQIFPIDQSLGNSSMTTNLFRFVRSSSLSPSSVNQNEVKRRPRISFDRSNSFELLRLRPTVRISRFSLMQCHRSKRRSATRHVWGQFDPSDLVAAAIFFTSVCRIDLLKVHLTIESKQNFLKEDFEKWTFNGVCASLVDGENWQLGSSIEQTTHHWKCWFSSVKINDRPTKTKSKRSSVDAAEIREIRQIEESLVRGNTNSTKNVSVLKLNRNETLLETVRAKSPNRFD